MVRKSDIAQNGAFSVKKLYIKQYILIIVIVNSTPYWTVLLDVEKMISEITDH